MRAGETENAVCPECGAPLGAGEAGDFCARCALDAAFGEDAICGGAEAIPQLLHPAEGEPRIFGDFELIEEIARGGMGVVLKARQRGLGRIVALKMLLPGTIGSEESVRRFRTEAEASARLQHPHIVAIHEVGKCEGQDYFAMDYIAGQDLARRVARAAVTPAQAARYVGLLAEAIHHAHQRGILHRDLKPANVLIDEHDQPFVTDFGIAKLLDSRRNLTATGHVFGTPSFMAPEQADPHRGETTVTSDVYGLGAILYFLLTGQPPFRADSLEQTIVSVLTREPAPPAQINDAVPRDLETICLKCLSKEPGRRYASAADLAADLTRWSRREPIQARPVSPPERVWLWARRNPGLAALSAALVVTLLAGTVLQELALRQARTARGAAENLIDYMNVDLTERLRPLGRLELLDNVNAKVEQYYQGLPMKEKTPALLARKARFYQNNASVLHDEGRLQEAETNALAALAILLPLQGRLPSEPAWPAALAGVYATLVKVHSDFGDLAAALAEGNAEVKCAETRRRLEPGSQPATAQLAEARFDLGNVLLKMDRTSEAAVQIDQGVALLEGYSSTVTNAPDRSTLLATGRYFQGLVQLKRQDLAGAMALFGQYQATFNKLAETDPANGALAREWMVAESRLGDTFFNVGDWDKAFEHFSQSYELARKLFEHDPTNLNHQKDAARNLEWLAETLMRRQAPESEILDYGGRAYEALKHLTERLPEDKVLGELAAKSLVNYTQWLNDHGHRDLSDQVIEREIADGWNFVKLAGGVTGHHRRFMEAIDFQDTALFFRGQNARRVEILQSWLAKTTAALPNGRITGGWGWTIGQLHAKLADACVRLGRFDDSLKELRLALPLQVAFATDEPQDYEVRNAAIESFRGVRALSSRLGDVAGALAVARQFLDWSLTNGSALAAPEKVRPRVVEVCLEAAAKAEGTKQRQEGGKLLADCLAGSFAGDANLTEGEAKLRARLAGEMTRLVAAQAPP